MRHVLRTTTKQMRRAKTFAGLQQVFYLKGNFLIRKGQKNESDQIEGIFSLVPELPSSYFSSKTTSGSGDTIRLRNNLISGVWPGSTSLGRDAWAGGCLIAIGILSNKVCDLHQLSSIPRGVGLNRVSSGQNTISMLRKSNTIIDTSLTNSRFIASALNIA